jgi:hypothetical protein
VAPGPGSDSVNRRIAAFQPDWKVLTSRSILAAWRKKPELPKPISWNVYKIASKAVRLGKVAAPGGKGGGGIQGAGREADGDTAVSKWPYHVALAALKGVRSS